RKLIGTNRTRAELRPTAPVRNSFVEHVCVFRFSQMHFHAPDGRVTIQECQGSDNNLFGRLFLGHCSGKGKPPLLACGSADNKLGAHCVRSSAEGTPDRTRIRSFLGRRTYMYHAEKHVLEKY
ncbi:unnamed protein product, partial [Polarella glacialis]